MARLTVSECRGPPPSIAMAESHQVSYSGDLNARFYSLLYYAEKFTFAGFLLGAIFYGITIILFFQCMSALFNHTWKDIKWALVAHTTAMFSFVTIYTATFLDIQSISYVDNREVPSVDGLFIPGPIGYQGLVYSKPISLVGTIVFFLNNGLADALLLYRCYVIYSMNCRVIAFPCLMYLVSLAIGVTFIYQSSRPAGIFGISAAFIDFGVPYYSISFALNVLLTLMIVGRLILLSRSIRNVMNAPVKVDGLYKSIVTSLIESCALYSVTFLLFIGSWAARNSLVALFLPILVEAQAIAPFLITIRIANRSASASVTIISGNADSIHFRSRGKSTSGNGAVLDGHLSSSVDGYGESRVKSDAGVEAAIDHDQGDWQYDRLE